MKRELHRLGTRAETFVHITQDEQHGVICVSIGAADHQVVYLNGYEAADLLDVLQQAIPRQQGGAA